MAWAIDWQVSVAGRDVTDALRPVLMDVSVTDKDGTESDTCQMSLDARGARIVLPQDGQRVAVAISGETVFSGVVDKVGFELSRGGGRVLKIGAKAFDAKGAVKGGQHWHMDDADLGEALRRAGARAGIPLVRIDPALASIRRDYWSPDGQSFLGWGARLAREFGATFKIRDGAAVLAARGSGLSPGGAAIPTVQAKVGGNLIACSVTPVTNRPRFGRARVRSFDRESGTFRTREVEIEPDVEGSDDVTTLAADEDQAEAQARGRQRQADRGGGTGSVTIECDPRAKVEGTLVLTGAYPGIDGTYRITGVTHRADRQGGATTQIDIGQPQGGARVDGRKASGQAATSATGGGGEVAAGSSPVEAASVRPANGFAGSPEASGRRRF